MAWKREDKRERHNTGLALLAAIKLARGCADCGYNERPEALDFDHPPGVVKFRGVGLMTMYSEERMLAEADLCEVVCANCHRIRTVDRQGRRSERH